MRQHLTNALSKATAQRRNFLEANRELIGDVLFGRIILQRKLTDVYEPTKSRPCCKCWDSADEPLLLGFEEDSTIASTVSPLGDLTRKITITNQDDFRYVHLERFEFDESHKVCKNCNPDNTKFCSNGISTSKYNVFTFLPVFLFEQFRKKANFYFLLVASFSFTDLSPESPLIGFAPLLFVLSVSAVKEIIEDIARHQQDTELNNTLVFVWRDDEFLRVPWKDIGVGDIVRIEENEDFPADLVMLKTSNSQGQCNVETANLDGETNLKIKQCVPSVQGMRCDPTGDTFPHIFKGILESTAPSLKMDHSSWHGNLIDLPGYQNSVALSYAQLLLRGCTLRNTQWVICLVAFTGNETKVMLNNDIVVYKRSNVDVIVDKALYVIFFLQFCLCVGGVVANFLLLNEKKDTNWYLDIVDGSAITLDALGSYVTFLVLLSLLVPISLYVSMELVKISQAWFINQDLDMYYEENDTPAMARTSNLNEELGQVSFLFSDKTGTLTCNQMDFMRCSVGGIQYGPGRMERLQDMPDKLPLREGIPSVGEDKSDHFQDHRLLHNLLNEHITAPIIDEFLTLLAVCHTVVPQFPTCYHGHIPGLNGCDEPVVYEASSPDERALVNAAWQCQYYFHHRSSCVHEIGGRKEEGQQLYVNILGIQYTFDLYGIVEFTSDRKRMSIVVRDPRDDKIKVYTKGADNVMYDILRSKCREMDWETCEDDLTRFAQQGLRTLVCAYKVLSEEELISWLDDYQRAQSALIGRGERLRENAELIECDLTLLGATAIEDKLQLGVPDTISKLLEAGISVWVLTGDKVQTAINIGLSCNLITPEMNARGVIVIEVSEKLKSAVAREETAKALEKAWIELKHERDDRALVINGRALGFIFPAQGLEGGDDMKNMPFFPFIRPHASVTQTRIQRYLLKVMLRCKAVLCCRVSPKQKADLVSLIRNNVENCITLAIGDGANDVPMIKAAHVGIGISGYEGVQAVMASDYSIGQFRFLQKLLFVHGSMSYSRMSLLILYSFYKNFVISFGHVYFAFFSASSGQGFYDPLQAALWNTIFTALPVLMAATFNLDYTNDMALMFPQLYSRGPKNELFNIKRLWLWISTGILHSTVIFFCVISTMGRGSDRNDGQVDDLWTFATTMYTCSLFVATGAISFLTKTWYWFHWILVIGSPIAYLVFIVVQSFLMEATPNMYFVAIRLMGNLNFWLVLAVICVIILLPHFTYEFWRRTWNPKPLDIINEIESGYGGSIVDLLDGRAALNAKFSTDMYLENKYLEQPDPRAVRDFKSLDLTEEEKVHDLTSPMLSIPDQRCEIRRTFSVGSTHGYVDFQADTDIDSSGGSLGFISSMFGSFRKKKKIKVDD